MKTCTVCGHPIPPNETMCPQCGRAHYGSVCPTCAQPAPTLVRGGKVVCSACGSTRGPLAGVPLNMVGSAHRVGSAVTAVFGWTLVVATVVGVLVAVGLGAVVGALVATAAHGAFIGLLFGLAIAVVGSLTGGLVLAGGRKLSRRGQEVRVGALEQSVLAMAAMRHGSVSAVEVSRNLGIPVPEADRILTELTHQGHASVEVNADGLVHYTFQQARVASPVSTRNAAVEVGTPGTTGIRVETVPSPGSNNAEQSPGDIARERVDREYEVMAERRRTGGI